MFLMASITRFITKTKDNFEFIFTILKQNYCLTMNEKTKTSVFVWYALMKYNLLAVKMS